MPAENEETRQGHGPLVVLTGPTAVGKTEASIQLAERLQGEIVSADSRLFYRGMDIGTAKPTPDELMRVPHHLIDIASPGEVWSLALYQEAARQAMDGIHARRHLPLLVGGTGQYVRCVYQGWQMPAVEPNPHLREILNSWGEQIGPEGLHARLAAIDPDAAAHMEPRNLRRSVRALEVILTTGRRFSEQRQSGESPYRLLLLGITRPRDELFARVDARIDAMLASGWLEEVQSLLDQGYDPSLPAFSAIGYRELAAVLQRRSTLGEAVMLIKRQTRIFVRRQANWFKLSDPNIHWFDAGPDLVDRMEAHIRGWMSEFPQLDLP
jgi:tRNA dimethylallyltransferase